MIAKLLICQSLKDRQEKIEKYFVDFGVKKKHPDVLYFEEGEKLGVEVAGKIREFLSTKPNQAQGKLVILEDGSKLTMEAQNSLLKTLEELPIKALFIIGASDENNFLPTVLSRCEIIIIKSTKSKRQEDHLNNVEELINSSLQQRFEYIEKCKDKEQLLKDIIYYFHQSLCLHLRGVNLNFLNELIEAEKWADSNGNIRAILEYLMLIMPKI